MRGFSTGVVGGLRPLAWGSNPRAGQYTAGTPHCCAGSACGWGGGSRRAGSLSPEGVVIWPEKAPGVGGRPEGATRGALRTLDRPRAEHPRSRPPRSVPGRDPPPAAWGEGGAPALTSGEGFIKATGGEEIPNAGAEPQRSRQRRPAAASPRPTRRRDAVVPPPVRPGPDHHRPGPRHRLGRPVGPAAPAVPAEVLGCCRREAGESPATGRPPLGHRDGPAADPHFSCRDPP